MQEIIGRAFAGLSGIKDAIIFPINPPAISELGNSAGFDFELEDQGSLGHEKLMAARNQLLGLAAQMCIRDRFGTEYAMRIWMDPAKLNSFNLTAGDVINAIAAQNVQVPTGQLGDRPAIVGQELNVTLQGQSTLRTPEEFGNILLHVNQDGSRVRLRDVARIALGGQNYVTQARVNGRLAAAVGIKLTPTANALATATAVKAKVAELAKLFPPGLQVDYPYDSSTFVHISIVRCV